MNTDVCYLQGVWEGIVEQAEEASHSIPPLERDKAILHASSVIKRLEEELKGTQEALSISLTPYTPSFEHLDVTALPKAERYSGNIEEILLCPR